jgi:NADPH-dependent ferric siderophore reductase
MTYRFFELEVARTRRVSPSVQRVTFRGAVPGGLAEFASGGRDQRFKLFFPQPGQDVAVVPVEAAENWYAQWRAMDPDERALMRTYTVRAQRRELGELDADFAVHMDPGPGAAWALGCLAGDRVTALGPGTAQNAGIDFRPPPDTDWILLAGDESALPAIAGILDWLGPATRVRAWIEVGHCDDVQALHTWADAEITWLVRGRGPALTHAVREARLPDGTAYAWIGGEAGEVRRLRRHLLAPEPEGRAFDPERVTFSGYWRRGATEEQLLAELYEASTAAAH